MGKKCTQAEMDHRIQQCHRFLVDLKPRSFIHQYAAEHWGIGPRATDTIIVRAREVLRSDCEVDRRDWLAQRLQLIDESIQEAKKAGPNSQSNLIGLIKLEASLVGFDI